MILIPPIFWLEVRSKKFEAVTPSAPTGPVNPIGTCAPAAPLGPVIPIGPWAPEGPAEPGSPPFKAKMAYGTAVNCY